MQLLQTLQSQIKWIKQLEKNKQTIISDALKKKYPSSYKSSFSNVCVRDKRSSDQCASCALFVFCFWFYFQVFLVLDMITFLIIKYSYCFTFPALLCSMCLWFNLSFGVRCALILLHPVLFGQLQSLVFVPSLVSCLLGLVSAVSHYPGVSHILSSCVCFQFALVHCPFAFFSRLFSEDSPLLSPQGFVDFVFGCHLEWKKLIT